MKILNKKVKLILFCLGAAIVAFTPSSMVASAKPPEKVSICHKTSSGAKPFTFITVSLKGSSHGHEKHPGDILEVTSPAECQSPPEVPSNHGAVTPVPPITLEPSAPPVPSLTPSPTPSYGSTNICHATGDQEQAYEFIPVIDDDTYLLHANHPGDIFDVEAPEDCPKRLQKFSADKQFRF